MTESERVAIAARLHVALRRKSGRVTDTEWMAVNPDYATEIVRFTRAFAAESSDLELGALAARLEAVMEPMVNAARTQAIKAAESTLRDAAKPAAPRYIGGLR